MRGLPGVGHCPHDEAPDLVNALAVDFVARVAAARPAARPAARGARGESRALPAGVVWRWPWE